VDSLAYGSTPLNYTALVIAIGICGLMWWRAKPKAVGYCVSAVATFFVFIYVLAPLQYGYEHGLRYFTPVAIGLTPAILALAVAGNRAWILAILALPLAAFIPSLIERVGTEFTAHSAASYAWLTKDPSYLEYNEHVLNGSERQTVKELQEMVPAGEPILAWINTPFYLEYRRNPIFDVDTAGIGVAWAALPRARYLIWAYDAFATVDEEHYLEFALHAGAAERRDALESLAFIERLRGLVEKGETLYDDEEVKVVRLPAW
jgi:hypothetical protein